MTEHETKGPNAEPESPRKEAGAAPDGTRRKLAKAALSAPVIMTLAPRRVMGAACATGVISIINSIDGAGGALPELAAGVSYSARAGEIDSCFDCLEKYADDCPDHVALRQVCESEDPVTAAKEFCPVDGQGQVGGTVDCVQTSSTGGATSESARWLQKRETILSDRAGTTTTATAPTVGCDPLSTAEPSTAPTSRRELRDNLRR